MINFNNLTSEAFAAFILAILFTVVSIASIIFFVKHKEAGTLVAVLTTLVFPFIAVFCWVYLIMSVNKFAYDISLIVSFACAIGYVLIALGIGYLVIYLAKRKEEKSKIVAEAEEVEQPQEEEEKPTLLLTHTDEVLLEKQEEKEENPDEQTVVFSNEEKKTFAEQLERLSRRQKKIYKEILEYAEEKEGTKTKEAKFQLTVSVGRMKLVLFKFVRDHLVASFLAGSSELKNYSASEKSVKIKEKPVLIEIENEDSIAVSKNMIDIVYKNILDAKEEKKETKKAERAEKKAKEQAENAQVQPKKRGRKPKNTQEQQ